MLPYPKLVWRLRINRDLSVRVDIGAVIMSFLVWFEEALTHFISDFHILPEIDVRKRKKEIALVFCRRKKKKKTCFGIISVCL